MLSAAPNVTVTVVAEDNTDVDPANAAVTVTLSDSPSATLELFTDNTISASSSAIVTIAAVAVPNDDEPVTVNVSGPSTTVSSVIVTPDNAPADDDTVLAGILTVSAVDGGE